MPVIWREKMSVGNDRVDRDHRYLICLINTIELALKSDGLTDVVTSTLEQLHFYTKDHFLREETLMLRIDYPKYMDQKKEHELLISKLEEIREKIKSEGEKPSMESILPELAELLRNWLLDHVLQDDMEMRPYFTKYPKEFV